MGDVAGPSFAHLVHDVPTPPRPPPSPPPVAPFRYPAWLLFSGVLVLGTAAYSIGLLPTYWHAHHLLRAAEMSRDRGEAAAAIRSYDALLAARPAMRSARIEAAILLFRSGIEADRPAALEHLAGVRLRPGEWNRLRAVLPEQLQELFTRVPRR